MDSYSRKDQLGSSHLSAKRQIQDWEAEEATIAIDTDLQKKLLGEEFDTLKPSEGFVDAFRKEYGLGREHWAEARRRTRWEEGETENAPRWTEMTQSYPLKIRVDQLSGRTNEKLNTTLTRMGMGLESPGNGRRAGQLLGTFAGDLTQDTSRGFYWLLNALQATGAVVTEGVVGKANKDLFGLKDVTYKDPDTGRDTVIDISDMRDRETATKLGFLDTHGNTRRGIRVKPQKGSEVTNAGSRKNRYLVRPRYNPGDLNSLLIPSGIAINSGLGLLTPIGGAEGYEAAVPDPDDKTKTSNAVAEVAAKYFLGRTGNLLPYDEFKKVRPDVSEGEYRAYKAFKYDKNLDLNPLDGDFTLPAGVVKGTTDSIHGPEIQFLGRGLPLTTGILPFMTSMVGTKIGVGSKTKPIRKGLAGGMIGLAAGQIAGNLLEAERRRRNQAGNQAYYDSVDKL